VSRPQGNGCDIGAYELLPATPAPVSGIVELRAIGSDSPQTKATEPSSSTLPIALVGGAVLGVIAGGSYGARRWLG
jgi:hypothetical protein